MTKRVKEEEKSTQKENHEIFLTLVPGTAIMDSGCRRELASGVPETAHSERLKLVRGRRRRTLPVRSWGSRR